MKCCRREKVDWSSCGHSNGQRCRRSDKQKQQECLLCRGAARSLLLLMPTSAASHLLRFPPFLPPSLQPLLASCLTIWTGWRSEEKAPAGSFSSPFFFFFPLALRGGNEVLTEEDWYFKMVLICLYFSPLMLASPSPFPRFPHFYLNHTSNNDLEERTEREAALWRVSSSFEKKKKSVR